jgi:hypothetical protein
VYLLDFGIAKLLNWRYRRATLARLLAREGMTQQVADAYTAVHAKL